MGLWLGKDLYDYNSGQKVRVVEDLNEHQVIVRDIEIQHGTGNMFNERVTGDKRAVDVSTLRETWEECGAYNWYLYKCRVLEMEIKNKTKEVADTKIQIDKDKQALSIERDYNRGVLKWLKEMNKDENLKQWAEWFKTMMGVIDGTMKWALITHEHATPKVVPLDKYLWCDSQTSNVPMVSLFGMKSSGKPMICKNSYPDGSGSWWTSFEVFETEQQAKDRACEIMSTRKSISDLEAMKSIGYKPTKEQIEHYNSGAYGKIEYIKNEIAKKMQEVERLQQTIIKED